MSDANKTKHLELIQGVVNRLSTNSFLLKGWSVVLVSALFALSAPNADPSFIFLAYIPAFIFWGLDGYFLLQERLFRDLYNHVRVLDESEIDFSMDTTRFRSGEKFRHSFRDWWAVVASKTLIPFHGVLVGAIVVVMALHIIN